MAKNYFDLKEYDRAAHFLHACTSPKVYFLYMYSRYLSGQKKKLDDSADAHGWLIYCSSSYMDIYNFYRLQRSCCKVIFSQASVIPCMCWGVSGRHPAGQTPPRQTAPPPRADTPCADPPGRYPPPPTPGQTPLPAADGRRLLQRTVRILLECILVFNSYGLCVVDVNKKVNIQLLILF